ncbi:hypothetical protein CTI12_AA311560 [Artemisia annua]|uniref:Endonuclease/exonuclease/phosphatase domain-containing protein n=1 Tax=Artemisia annua TaxID=35608 RepID=A0A2U1N3N5_ARTAN|nr:hypothetical protein CTI12_AA311560 [Artemisia annua]
MGMGEKEEQRKQEENIVSKADEMDIRKIEVKDEETNVSFFNKCLIGEVKSLCFLTKLPSFCSEQGLNKVEVKMLGGLEIMLIFDTPETATNILSNINHGLRRWVHKLRRWNKFYIIPGRLTWINIIGVPVTCWSEQVFKKIAALHGRITGTSNCGMEGNQSMIVAKVQVHTWNKGLINESLIVKVLGKEYKVNVIEEVGDIMEVEWEEENDESDNENGFMDMPKEENDDMVMSENESENGSSEEESVADKQEECGEAEHGNRSGNDGGRNKEEYEESRCGSNEKVSETFEVEDTLEKEKAAKEYGEHKDILSMLSKEGTNKDVDVGSQDIANSYEKNETREYAVQINQNDSEMGRGKNSGHGRDKESPLQGKEVHGPCSPVAINGVGSNISNNGHKTKRFRRVKDKGCNKEVDKGCNKEVMDNIEDSQSARGQTRMMRVNQKWVTKKKEDIGVMDKDEFDKTLNGNMFVNGADDRGDNSKKKLGRRSITKAMAVARECGVKGLGADKKGISDAYKEYHEVENDEDGVFVFKSSGRADSNNKSCSINMEQVKEIGEMIGISWNKAENEKSKCEKAKTEKKEGEEEVGKKDWVKSIIRDERPDIIGIQETKCGVVDELWVEDIWGGRGFGFAQLAANGNSGGILLIWDSSSFTYRDGMGDERFVAVKGEWKGRNGDIFIACIYGPHVARQKASLWDRLLELMKESNGAWCMFGDLNVVRGNEERMNSQVYIKEANLKNLQTAFYGPALRFVMDLK